ncbi:MAG: hypothetical protein IJO06_03680 [Thermoguttaceae bacterium]|nr:hypothetical protein [Thermoguttaceae bacterium]
MSEKSLLGKFAATARRVADVAEAADKANLFAKKEAPETLQTPETSETPSPSNAEPAPEKKSAFDRVAGVAENLASFAQKESAQPSVPAESLAAPERPSESEPQSEENTVEPLPPAPPQIPESFGDEVYRVCDLVLYQGGFVKGNRVVYYRSATRVSLKAKVCIPPGAPEYRGRSVGDAVEAGMMLGDLSLTPVGAIVGMAVGGMIGGALGLLEAIAPTPEDHNQIWLETDDSSEPFLLYSERRENSVAANAIVTRLCDGIEKARSEPEILLDDQKIKRKYYLWFLCVYKKRFFFK